MVNLKAPPSFEYMPKRIKRKGYVWNSGKKAILRVDFGELLSLDEFQMEPGKSVLATLNVQTNQRRIDIYYFMW